MKTTIVTYDANGTKNVWSPTTLDEMKKDEQYLESVIAETPELLRLDTRKTGVYGPYAVFRQLRFATPQSREIIPDIVLLSASGDVIVVEVKRSLNPELKDRRVIAQAIDYAASLSALSEKELARLFSQGRESVWISLMNSLFPGDEEPEELAAALLSNIGTGKIHVVIACDKAPAGLYELAKSVSVQSYLSFSLDVLEITPFLSDNGVADQIMFVPNLRLSTEIVARTAITITYQQGLPEPSVSISTTGIDEIEENLAAVSRGDASIEVDPVFSDVISAYDQTAEEEWKTRGHGRRYRQIRPDKWPGSVHYEIMNYQYEIGVELHLESDAVTSLAAHLTPVAGRDLIPGVRVEWDARWARNRGRLIAKIGKDQDPQLAAHAMCKLIEITRPIMETNLRQ
jgi:hypothetical protein